MELQIREFLSKAERQRDTDSLKKAYELLNEGTKENTVSSGRCFCPELCVLCAEQACQVGLTEIAEACLVMYFKGKPPTSQFLCRAYLCQGQLSARGSENMDDVERAVMYFLKAIEISKEQPRYHFLVFNASVLYFQTIRPVLCPGSRQRLHASLVQVLRALEEVGETDYRWRAELMLVLIECLVEAGKLKEATSWGKTAADFIGAHTPDLYPCIFTLQVRHKLLDLSRTPKKAEESVALSVIYKIQKLKHQASGSGRRDNGAKLKEIFLLLTNPTAARPPGTAQGSKPSLAENKSPIAPEERTSFLLELGHLALQMNVPQMTSDCLKELKLAGLSEAGLLISMECLRCELELHKRGPKIEEYKRSDVEAQQKLVSRLDQLLQNALRVGETRTVQGVCASLWNACLPLLQHNLRRSIRKPLLRLAQVLEDSNSTLLELRCQVHCEVGAIEAEEDRVESATEHVQKALRLDVKGQQRDRLTAALHALRLRALLYETPERSEDRAALLIQQAKTANSKESRRKVRPMLVNAGIALAPDDFRAVLDADNPTKVSSDSRGGTVVSQLSAKAQHHTAGVQRVEEHLKRRGGKKDPERVRLWAELAKVSRKLEAWSMCRAACRFCVLHDDGRLVTLSGNGENKEDESAVDTPVSCPERDLRRLLAEVRFINGEATVQKLRSEGVQLNGTPVLPPQKGKRPAEGSLSQLENDSEWETYRDWVQSLSAYATSNFLRAAELGAELGEAWIVSNAAVYLWNYNSHIVASGGQRHLLVTFQTLIDLLKQTGDAGQPQLQVLLCNAVAQGLIWPWTPSACSPTPEGRDSDRAPPSRARKGAERTGSQAQPLEPAANQDMRKALELCEYALRLATGSRSADAVSVATRKQIIGTWVRTKQLLQQQIGQKLDFEEEGKATEMMPMWRVLVGVEMMVCNFSSKVMEFSVPSAAELVRLVGECSWEDPLVELQVWTHLAHFSHQAQEQELVMTCSQNALQLEALALKKVKVATLALYNNKQVYEMLSSVACLRGLSLVQTSRGHPDTHRAGLYSLQSSVSYAEKAGSRPLCMEGARHYWNSCLPLLRVPQDRQQLQTSVEKILRAMANTSSRDGEDEGTNIPGKLTSVSLPGSGRSTVRISGAVSPDDDLTLRAAFYGLIFCIYGDRNDWQGGLRVLDQAVREMPRTRHRLPLFKQRALARARLGESLLVDMQRFGEEGEQCLSHMWHHMAHCSPAPEHKVVCFQNAITSLQSSGSLWLRVDYLLEFGEWLFQAHFPAAEALEQVRRAEDLLLHEEPGEQLEREHSGLEIRCEESQEEPEAPSPAVEEPELVPVTGESQAAVRSPDSRLALSVLRDVRQLEGLLRVHTLWASLTPGAPTHLQQCLLAHTCVLRLWQVSVGAAGEVSTEMTDQTPLSPHTPASATAKRDKQKKSKEGPLLAAEDKPKRKGPAEPPQAVLPTSPEEWARFDCPPEVRQAFRRDRSPRTINQHSVRNQTQTLYFLDLLVKELNSRALTHLTLPVLHLAEVIASELMENKSVSDLYRLRIARACSQLRLDSAASYQEKLVGPLYIYEEERMMCREALALLREDSGCDMSQDNSKTYEAVIDSISVAGRKLSRRCVQGMWAEKAEILLELGRYQAARELLAEAHLVSTKVGDRTTLAKTLLLLAELANQERHPSQALLLLKEAQAIGGDEDFCYRVTLCLVKATVDGDGEQNGTQACQILKHASAVLWSVLKERPNRGPVLRFLVASLETRRAVLQVKTLETATDNSELMKTLTLASDTLRQSADEFVELGHQEHAAETILERANTLRLLAKHSDSKEKQRRHLLDSYTLMHEAVFKQEEVVFAALGLMPAHSNGAFSLPAVRKLVCHRLALAGLLIDMLGEVCEEQKDWEQERERRGSVERTVEDFLQGSSDLTPLQQEWQSASRTLGQEALTQLQTVLGISGGSLEDRATALSMLGHCLRLLAVQRDPMHPSTQWDIPNAAPTAPHTADPDSAKEQKKAEPGDADLAEQEAEPEENHEPGVKYRTQSAATSTKLQGRREAARRLLAQASETLAQAVSLCLQHRLTQPLPRACLAALECYCQYDPSTAGQYLALYQSSVCCGQMAGLLRSACSDSSESQLSALLTLRTNLQAAAQCGGSASGLLGPTHDTLAQLSKAYSHLSINPNHLSILAELPSSFNILMLQHSLDGSVLYGALFEKARPVDSQRGKGPLMAAGSLDCSAIAKVKVSPTTLSRLRERARFFKQEVAKAVMRGGNQFSGTRGAVHAMKSHPNLPSEITAEFNTLVQEMEGYLHPLLSQLTPPWVRGGVSSAPHSENIKPREKEERSGGDKGQTPGGAGASVVLLVDSVLMDLPLEALSLLQEESVSSVSRDFSLQLLHSRLQRREPVESESKKEGAGGRGGKARGDQSKTFKAAPASGELPADSLPVDVHNIRYVVDPYKDGGETGEGGPVHGMRRVLEAHSQHMTPLWEGILGPEHTPGLDELEHLLTNCSTFIFNGTERFSANIPPSKMISLALSDCQMVMLFDLAQTRSSALRQTKLDALKSPAQLALEGPLGTAALLSMGGVRAITLNQWHSTLQKNTCDMESILNSLLKVGVPSGQAVHALRQETISERAESGENYQKESVVPEFPEVTRGSSQSASPALFNHIIYGLPNLVLT